jgi:predicted  nucleic acid-binding Zn-ribbon protein
MGTMLSALQNLQAIERQLADVRGRLRTRKNAVAAQQKKIDQFRHDWETLNQKSMTRRQDADRFDLDLKTKEEQVSKLRTALNGAKTNKEYAAILTQINTYKADNAKLEEEVLKIMQEVDTLKAEAGKIHVHVEEEENRLSGVQSNSGEEIERLTKMFDELSARRAEAAKAVPAEVLVIFERIAGNYEGDAMAVVETHGKKPPFDYVCGGCYMSLNAEHANALRVRDEIRRCDNCGRILYLEPQQDRQQATKS